MCTLTDITQWSCSVLSRHVTLTHSLIW